MAGFSVSRCIFIEVVFNYNGLGLETVNAIKTKDIPVATGAVLYIALVFVLVNMLTDILYELTDPRVKMQQTNIENLCVRIYGQQDDPGAETGQKLGLDFYDLDALIEDAAGMKVAEIFAEKGGTAFQRAGSRCIAGGTVLFPDAVIACGGGTPLLLQQYAVDE